MNLVQIKNKNLYRIILFAMSFCVIVAVYSVNAQSSKNKGLKFVVPDDWPVEKRSGLLGPIPTEEYIVIKFKEIKEEFSSIKNDVSEKINELKTNLTNMETKFKKDINQAQSNTPAPVSLNNDLSEILSRLNALEIQINNLDQKMSNNSTEVRNQINNTAVHLEAVDKKFKNLQTLIYKLDEEVDYLLQVQYQQP